MMATLSRRLRRLALLGPAALALSGAPLAAQQRIAVLTEPGTPVIATEVLVATGPLDEDSTRMGIAHLAARTVTAPLAALLDSLDAHLVLSPRKDAISLTLTTSPDAWEAASRALLVALFRDPPDSLTLVRERRAIVADLLARETNPADAVAREAEAAFFGPRHPWGRPAVGTPASLARVSLRDVDRYLRTHFTPSRTRVAVVGPIEGQQVDELLMPLLEGDDGQPPSTAPPRAPQRLVRRDYNSITTWVAASFGFPPQVDEEALRMLAHLTREALLSGPDQHLVYNVRTEVISRPGGGELRFRVVLPPHEAERWTDRVERTLLRVAEQRFLPGEWEPRLRRYRGERLQELLAPEDRAREAARRLLLNAEADRLLPNFESLSPARLRAAAISLSEPSVVLLGPFLDDAGR